MSQKTMVKVVVFGGAIVEKVLVNEHDDVLLVTSEREWEAAERENRPPVVVGFRKEYMACIQYRC